MSHIYCGFGKVLDFAFTIYFVQYLIDFPKQLFFVWLLLYEYWH